MKLKIIRRKEIRGIGKAFLTLSFVGILSIMSFAFRQRPPWVAPPSADKIVNPLKGNAAATAEGKKLYAQRCAVCHGVKGKGDGIAAAGLHPRPADHTSARVQAQTDGAIFWKMTNGNPPMAAYKTVLTEKQRWELVNYIRVLGAAAKGKK